MLSDPVTVKILGLDKFRAEMSKLQPTLQKKILGKLIGDSMKVVRDEARRLVPVAKTVKMVRGQVARLPGTVRRNIAVRASRFEKSQGKVGVFVNVRPFGSTSKNKASLKVRRQASKLSSKSERKAIMQAGANNPRDPFYWRWLEHPTEGKPHRPFLQPAAEKLRAAYVIFELKMNNWINQANKSGRIE